MHYLDTLYTPVVVVFLVLWGAMVFTLARSPTTAWLFNLELANRISPFLLLVSVGLATLCMYEIAALWSRSPHIVNVTKAGFPPLITVNPDPVVPFIILMFTSAFFFGLPYAAAANPPLPTVSVTTKDRPPQCFTANLVAHTDGFWHLFDEQRDDQPRYLLSIPDDRVCKAEMQPKGQR
jgi:hypothetical protein